MDRASEKKNAPGIRSLGRIFFMAVGRSAAGRPQVRWYSPSRCTVSEKNAGGLHRTSYPWRVITAQVLRCAYLCIGSNFFPPDSTNLLKNST